MATQRKLTPWRVALFVLLSPFAAAYGVVVLLRGALGVLRRVTGAKRALSSVLVCPNGHANETTGRWECARCKATYLGWVGRCTLCGAGAGWMSCKVCGVGIPFPWSRR